MFDWEREVDIDQTEGTVPICVIADEFRDRIEEAKDPKKGDHGYDNRLEQMKAIFIAYGPSVQMNHIAKPFQNIELYNFFASM